MKIDCFKTSFVLVAFLLSFYTQTFSASAIENTVTRKIEDYSSPTGIKYLAVTNKFDPTIWKHEEYKVKGQYPGDIFSCLKLSICGDGTRVYQFYWKFGFLRPYNAESIPKLPITDKNINLHFLNLAIWATKKIGLELTEFDKMEISKIAGTPAVLSLFGASERAPRMKDGFKRTISWYLKQYVTVQDNLALITTIRLGKWKSGQSPKQKGFDSTIKFLINSRTHKFVSK